MKTSQLLPVVARVLADLEIAGEADADAGCFSFVVEGPELTFTGRVICEEHPDAVQVLCILPVATRRRNRRGMLELLNPLNGTIRFGRYYAAVADAIMADQCRATEPAADSVTDATYGGETPDPVHRVAGLN